MGISRALIFGISDYTREQDKLLYARSSAEKFGSILEEHYVFDEVKLLPEPDAKEELSADDIQTALMSLKGLTADDTVLLCFCGHGTTIEKNWYFVPQDTALDDTDYRNFFSGYELILEFLGGTTPAHILLIVDTCYGGLLARYGELPLFRGMDVESDLDNHNPVLEKLISPENHSRYLFTAGSETEPVPDRGGDNSSVFMEKICDYLLENTRYFLPASIFASEVKEEVLSQYKNALDYYPTPHHRHIGPDMGGEFCFVRKGAKPGMELDFSSSTVDLLWKGGDSAAVKRCQQLASEIEKYADDGDLDIILKIISHMTDCLLQYPGDARPLPLFSKERQPNAELAISFSDVLSNTVRAFGKAGRLDEMACVMDILKDVACRYNMERRVRVNFGRGLFHFIEFTIDSKKYESERKRFLPQLRTLAAEYPLHLRSQWGLAESFASERPKHDCLPEGENQTPAKYRDALLDLRIKANRSFPLKANFLTRKRTFWTAEGGVWIAYRTKSITERFSLTNDPKDIESARVELNSLIVLLLEPFAQTVRSFFCGTVAESDSDQGFGWNINDEIDCERFQDPSFRHDFISSLASSIYLICEEVSHYKSRVKEMGDLFRSSIKESLESEVVPEKGLLFSEAAYWSIIREMTTKIISPTPEGDLLLAAYCGDIKSMQSLLSRGIDANAIWCKTWSPLVIAAGEGHSEVVKMLPDRGANVNGMFLSKTALSVALQKNRDKVVTILMEAGADFEKATRPLIAFDSSAVMAALARGDNELSFKGTNVDDEDPNAIQAPMDSIHMARATKGYSIEEMMAEFNNSFLIRAAYFGEIDYVRMLIADGADVNTENVRGDTALMFAQLQGHTEIEELLKKAGAKK